MCRNHSHITGYVTEAIQTDQFAVHTVVPERNVSVEMPTGARLMLPSSTTLFALWLEQGTLCSPELREMVAHTIALSVVGWTAYGCEPPTRWSLRTGSYGSVKETTKYSDEGR